MSTRRILHHGPTPSGTPVLLSDRAIGGCWFELHRQGGCGAGELVLQREFQERGAIEIGDWISCEGAVGQRWYLGRVEECRYQYPGLMRLRLAGMSIELNEVFPGGFDTSPPERQPQRYGATDLFSNDPDRNWEAAHAVSSIDAFVRLLLQQHVVNKTNITYLPGLVEAPHRPVKTLTAKFRGEESLRSILKDLALRAQASWGVDAFGRFFFLRRRISVQSTFRLGRDLVSLEETRDRELIFNRLLLTGDYIYDHRDNSSQIARRVYRWRANYFEPDSCQAFGNRRLRLWVPWMRTQSDSVAFAREFFRTYSQPTARYAVETLPQSTLLIPWEGPVTIEDASGAQLSTGVIEKVRVLFDHAPRFRLEVGPEDPREQWPEPPQDERWELPDHVPSNGGDISLTDQILSSHGGGDSSSSDNPPSSPGTSSLSSDLSSNSSDSSGSSDSSNSSNSSNSSDSSEGSSGASTDPSWSLSSEISEDATSLSDWDSEGSGSTSEMTSLSTAPSSVTSASSDGLSSSESSSAPTTASSETSLSSDESSTPSTALTSVESSTSSGMTSLSMNPTSGTTSSGDATTSNASSSGSTSAGQTSSGLTSATSDDSGTTGSGSSNNAGTSSDLSSETSSDWSQSLSGTNTSTDPTASSAFSTDNTSFEPTSSTGGNSGSGSSSTQSLSTDSSSFWTSSSSWLSSSDGSSTGTGSSTSSSTSSGS